MKKLKLNKKNAIILGAIVALLVGGIILAVTCLGKKEVDNKGYTNVPHEEEEIYDQPKVQIVDVSSKSRPFAVMINNAPAARPYHSGLQDAFLVYEIVVEGGITRYMALFKDELPEIVGSVRSARHYYLDYVLENDAYYVHWGWSPQAQKDISTLGINNINALTYSNPYFFRKQYGSVATEHTGYTNLKEVSKLVSSKGYRDEANKNLLLHYSPTPINPEIKRDDAVKINIKYSSGFVTNYVYDEKSNTYLQSVNNVAHKDYQTKEQYSVKNILVYQIDNKTIAGDDKGRQELDNKGHGEGYFITGGVSYPITWDKEDRSSQTVYKYKETGEEITVNDGNTWIHIVPKTGSISIS